MSNLTIQELQQKLDNAEKLLALLVMVADDKLPKLKQEVQQITGIIQGGFNTQELAKQSAATLNQVISQSDYTKLKTEVNQTTDILKTAISESSRKVEKWRDEYHRKSSWHYALISGISCFFLGVILALGINWYYKIPANLAGTSRYTTLQLWYDDMNETMRKDCILAKRYYMDHNWKWANQCGVYTDSKGIVQLNYPLKTSQDLISGN